MVSWAPAASITSMTTYGYEDYNADMKGRQNKTVAPDGTITRMVYDGPR